MGIQECGPDPDASVDGGSSSSGAVVTCDGGADCLTNDVAVFVDGAKGNDSAAGTREQPFRTIGAALAKRGDKSVVNVCEGVYAENVEITTPVALVGGLTCSWQPSTSQPKIAPPSGIGIRITSVSAAVVVKDLEVDGTARGDVPGDSAIAVFASSSKDVSLTNMTLVAGPGTNGKPGDTGSNYMGASATPGGAANGSIAGVGARCTCTDGSMSKGGNGASGTGAGIADGMAAPTAGTSNAGSSSTLSCTDGTVGANGKAPTATEIQDPKGVLTVMGWVAPAGSTAGLAGNPAQGGGGGGAKTQSNSAGGGGACGGCGGGGGAGGAGGGSSFALLSFNTQVKISGSKFSTGAGGMGGRGGDGQIGQAGGGVGVGACNGGAGGNGSGGNGGTGGVGGHSIPIGWVGSEPSVMTTQLLPASFGLGGEGGKAGLGPGNPGNVGATGANGKAVNSLQL